MLGASGGESYLPHSTQKAERERERKGWDPNLPFQDTPPNDLISSHEDALPSFHHLLIVPPAEDQTFSNILANTYISMHTALKSLILTLLLALKKSPQILQLKKMVTI
jgi:hypothetical protein